MTTQGILGRIWAHDHTVWQPEPDEITNRLGWLHLPKTMTEELGRIQRFTDSVRADGFTHVLLLGMGGSSLAPEVFSQTFGPTHEGLSLAVLDSTHPDAVLAQTRQLDYTRTLFIVSTKSGGTVETLSLFKYFYNQVAGTSAGETAGSHFVAITDPGSTLVNLAETYHFREIFLNDPNIGGRYSALSFFGLVTAALIGVDIERLLKRAQTMTGTAGDKSGALLGAILGESAKNGRDKMTLIASPEIASFGDWVEQLIAESTGKEGNGILPVVNESPGRPEDYGSDRLFIYLRLGNDQTHEQALNKLAVAGYPVIEIELADRYDIGQQFFLWEMATAVAGYRLGIHPFDQPNVESAKKRATAMVDAYQKQGQLPESEGQPLTPEALTEFLKQARPGDYIAVQAYVQPTAEIEAILRAYRLKLRNQTKLAVTLGYGPRFLHSTGQLHKGDGGNGWFIQLTSDAATEVPVPDTAGAEGSSITFNVLILAQALGDKQALEDAGRSVIRFHLGHEPITELQKLSD
jgi:glucose-6-phosphate isomerase